jgi:hypothetical protein
LTLLWQLHHELHAELARRGNLEHLSDELLLLPTSALPPFTEGIVNDGMFAAGWIRSQGGQILYADGAAVELSAPQRLAEHVGQRRRIRRGHHALGARPTWTAFALREPRRAFEMLVGLVRQPRASRHFSVLVVAETAAVLLGGWDHARGRDYTLWPRIPSTEFAPRGDPRSHVAER